MDELNRTATTSPSNIPSATPFNLNADELLAAFTNFLAFDVGSGGASAETIRIYWCEVRYYLLWCETNQLQPLTVTRDTIKIYRHHLVSKKYKPATISLKGYSIAAITPLFINLYNRPKHLTEEEQDYRLSRRGVRKIVDSYLTALNLKYGEGRTLSTHSLRHTAGTLAIQSGASLRQVQDLLGHADPRTTAIYTHVGDRWTNNPALNLGIKLKPDE